ncbi:hypothetical protein LTS17_001319 [Exophiala oligosperma]
MRDNLEQVMKKLTPTNASDVELLRTAPPSTQVTMVPYPTVVPDSSGRERAGETHSADSSPCRGPTSSGFAFEVARQRLQTLGLDSVETEPLSRRDELSFASVSAFRILDLGNIRSLLEKDPLWHMSQEEVFGLIASWSNTIGRLFPVVNTETLQARWISLDKLMTRARTSVAKQDCLSVVDALFDGETHLLKLVLANSLTAGSGGVNETAKRLFESTGSAAQAAFTETPSLGNINMLVLVAILYYHLDDEMRANRLISLAVRLCFEMGLHRTETFQHIKEQNDRVTAITTFWSVYVLERRSSIGLGVPFIMQDSEIEPSVPRPSQYPYLEAMVGLTRLSAEISRRMSMLRDRSMTFPVEEVDYQDYKVLQWQKQLSPDLTLDVGNLQMNQQVQLELSKVPAMYVAIVLHIRTQQLRSLIYRPVLYSAARIADNKKHSQLAVDIARESVQFLALASRTTTLAQDEPLFFRDFLISHLAGILLAVSNAPAVFGHQLCDEFYLVMDVLRNLSPRSPVIARVWSSIRILEIVGPKLGLRRETRNMEGQNVEDVYLQHSQVAGGLACAENEPVMPMSSIRSQMQPTHDQTIFESKDFAFSTSMFPSLLRSELSMMDEPLDDVTTNLLGYSLPDDLHDTTSWQW